MPPKATSRGGVRRKRKQEDEESDNENELAPEAPPRPFKEVYGLPVTSDPPEYNILGHALSVADSAVLYSSLMQSRKGYMISNVFELYWAKGKTKFESDINARDRMNKLCDCKMEMGPHTFDVRFFILKDDEIERQREEEKEKKKERRMVNKKIREDQQKVRELKKQGLPIPTDLQASAASAPIDIRSDNIKPDVSEGKANDKDQDNDKNDSDDEDEDEEEEREGASREASIPAEASVADVSSSLQPPQNEPVKETKGAHPSGNDVVKETRKPLPPLQSTKTPSEVSEQGISQPTQETASPTPSATTSVPVAPSEDHATTQQQQQQQNTNDMMQTPESQMMIANLNAIARADPSLNTLMKIVASGNASQAQIKEFQGYIQKAKSMGPTPYFKQAFPNYKPAKPPKPPKAPKAPKPSREKTLTTFQEKYVNGADLVFEFSESPNVRFNLPKDCIVEKSAPNEYIVSFLVIFNDEKIRRWELRQKNKKEKLEEKRKAEEAKPQRRTRGKEETADQKVKEEPKDDGDVKPAPYFTAFSFKIQGVEDKYDPIFINSFHKTEKVLKTMENIIEEGSRAPKYLLWYQVDAYDDENLAETLREQLELLENPPKKYKKRNTEEQNPLLVKPKRQKKENA